MRTRLEITPLGASALALFHLSTGAALITGDRTAQLAASLLFAPIAIDVIDKVRRRPRLRLSAAPGRTEAKRPFLDRFAIENGPARLHGLHLRSDRSTGAAQRAVIEDLDPREEREIRVPSRGLRRGRYEERSIDIRTGHPLGLWRWRAQPTIDSVLIVEPAREELPPQARSALEGSAAENRTRRDAEPEVFHSMRELRFGEDARRLHALRSATLGRPVVRVDHGLAEDSWTVVLDLRRAPGAMRDSRRRDFERQLGRVAKVVDLALQRRVTLTVTVIGDEITHHPIGHLTAGRRLLEVLATARPIAYRSLEPDELGLERRGGSLWVSSQGCSDATSRLAVDSYGFVEVPA